MTDAILVRAPAASVYRVLTDLDGWPRWHARCRTVRLPDDATRDGDGHAVRLPDGRRSWRIEVRAHGWRHDLGVRWEVRGAVALATEWWLEPVAEGTVVHHVVHASPAGRRDEARIARHRRAVGGAMQALKDHLELAVAIADGRLP